MLLGASCAFAQNGNAPLSQLLDTYNQATNGWIDQFQNYAMNLFVALAGIEFAWTAVLLLLEQRDLEGWVAGFIKKLMGVSFFYALLLYAPTWIPAIINSFTQIGGSVGGTGKLTPEAILLAGTTMAGQILKNAALIILVATATGNVSWVILLFAIAIVIIICYIVIAFQFIMAQVEGYIVISTGMLYLGFGGSRWTSSYVERFLGTAVSTGIRIMVIFLIVGLGQQLTNSTWSPAVAAILPKVLAGDLPGAADSAFLLVAGITIFTALALRLPKVVSSVISGSPSLSGGDLAGGVGSIFGGAAAVAGMIAAPEALAAKAGASAGAAGAEGAMSASKAAGFISAPNGPSTMGLPAKEISPPSSQGVASKQMGPPPSPSAANSLSGSSSTASSVPPRSGSIAGPTVQPLPPSPSSSNGAGAGDASSAAVNGSTSPATPPLAESPASDSPASAPLPSPDSASGGPTAMPSKADVQPPGQSGGNGTSAAQNFFAAARSVSDGLRQAQGAFTSMENDGGGASVSPPTPNVGRD
jgi:type IV secretion system protein TrbL